MSDVNKIQVGGDHYRSEYQHWDFIEDWNLTYLIGCATKYVCRAYKKSGKMDLEKALHYIDKIAERYKRGRTRSAYLCGVVSRTDISKFAICNNLDEKQAAAFELLVTWDNLNDLNLARVYVQEILESL